jgi:hypothetical protein
LEFDPIKGQIIQGEILDFGFWILELKTITLFASKM